MWYLVLSKNLKTDAEREAATPAHLGWLADLHRAGRALFSGRTADGAYGIYVLLAENLEAGRALAAQDPYHVCGDRVLEQVLEWAPKRAMRLDVSIDDIEAMATKNRAIKT